MDVANLGLACCILSFCFSRFTISLSLFKFDCLTVNLRCFDIFLVHCESETSPQLRMSAISMLLADPRAARRRLTIWKRRFREDIVFFALDEQDYCTVTASLESGRET